MVRREVHTLRYRPAARIGEVHRIGISTIYKEATARPLSKSVFKRFRRISRSLAEEQYVFVFQFCHYSMLATRINVMHEYPPSYCRVNDIPAVCIEEAMREVRKLEDDGLRKGEEGWVGLSRVSHPQLLVVAGQSADSHSSTIFSLDIFTSSSIHIMHSSLIYFCTCKKSFKSY